MRGPCFFIAIFGDFIRLFQGPMLYNIFADKFGGKIAVLAQFTIIACEKK
jgi:hypothetical protein